MAAAEPWWEKADGFQWDEGNQSKNWEKHRVRAEECESAFYRKPLVVFADEAHSLVESRFYAFGKTDAGRMLLMVFCGRNNRIRIISARDMDRKERRFYEAQENSEIPE